MGGCTEKTHPVRDGPVQVGWDQGVDPGVAPRCEVALFSGIEGPARGVEAEAQAGVAGGLHPPAHPLVGFEHRDALREAGARDDEVAQGMGRAVGHRDAGRWRTACPHHQGLSLIQL